MYTAEIKEAHDYWRDLHSKRILQKPSPLQQQAGFDLRPPVSKIVDFFGAY